MVLALADDIVASPKLSGHSLDINIVRALLYLQRSDPRIDQRVRQYLYGRQLTDLAAEAVAALDPNTGEGRAFEIIELLGRLMWTVDRSALVFTIDQVEDLRFFDDPQDRFQKAARDLIQVANRVPTAIIIVSCLGDFYGSVRDALAQSYIDRIEKAGPVRLDEARSAEEARLIIAKRLAQEGGDRDGDPTLEFGPQFFEEFSGLSTRRILELAQTRMREQSDGHAERVPEEKGGFISTLAAALGFGSAAAPDEESDAEAIDFRELWERFTAQSEAEIPSDDQGLLDVLTGALGLAREEWGKAIDLTLKRPTVADDLPTIDLASRHETGFASEARIFLCNRPTQGGGFKRQLDRLLPAMMGKNCFMLRASDFPPNKKNQTAQAFRKFREGGGRSILVPITDWERMMMVREFHAQHRHDPGFADWFEHAKLLSDIPALVQMLRLDLFRREAPPVKPLPAAAAAAAEPAPAEEKELPLSVLLDEAGDGSGSILAGRALRSNNRITLNKSVLKRHTAVLGGSGSGKTTLALCIIEQLLLRGTPAVLIDRKGDLCSYANPEVWRSLEGELGERRGEREKLADSIDVAVYTPGRASGRPISITLLPNGINELPDQEQQLLANMSAAALGDMLHLKNSATHQKQSGTLSVALRILGGRSAKEVTLNDLIGLLEEEDPELTDLTQRMDPSGRIRRDLVAQLDSLRHRNSALFEGGGEPLRMEALLAPVATAGATGARASRSSTRASSATTRTSCSGSRSSSRRRCASASATPMTSCRPSSCSTRPTSTSLPTPSQPPPSRCRASSSAPAPPASASCSPPSRRATSTTSRATRSPRGSSAACARTRHCGSCAPRSRASSGLDPAAVLPGQTVGEFHLVQEGLVRPMRAHRSLINAEQVPFDRIEQLARETKGQDEKQLKLFG